MLKLRGYLKPFIAVLLLAIVLLFGQAICDLCLPNYMSNIVNVGLQQSGIERCAPSAISKNGMKLMQSFMSDEERTLVDNGYALRPLTEKTANGDELSKLYPSVSEDSLYIVQSDAELDELDTAFGNASWVMIQTMRAMADISGQTQQPANVEDMDPSMLYNILPMLDKLPPSLIGSVRESVTEVDAALIKQSALAVTRMFYEELGVDVNAMQDSYVLRMGLRMLFIAILGGIATILVNFIFTRIAAGAARNMRRDLFKKVESFSCGEFDKFSTASLITRTTNDIGQIQMFLHVGMRTICYAPFLGIGGVLMALDKSPSMSWMLAIACLAILGMMLVIFSLAIPRFKKLQKLTDRLNLVSRESLTGLMVIRAFGTQRHEEERFDDANKELKRVNLFVNRVIIFMVPVMTLVMNGLSLLIVWVGAHQVAQATMQVGDIIAYIQYAMFVIMGFLMISMMFIFIPRASVSAERIYEVMSTQPGICDPEHPESFDGKKRGIIEFRNVSFRYDGADEDVLHDISFKTRLGETTAIIGPTGSGKSTIVNLIMRFYDVTGGQILVDGKDIREVSQMELRDRFGYVPQRGVLLSGSIASNLKYGRPDAEDSKMYEAAAIAQAEEFIEKLDGKYDYEIAQGGTNVSGGQKQRLSIARALVKEPEFYIFDDSFSALDFKTDAALRKALRRNTGKNTTTLIVTQRVSTILQANQILVLNEHGRLVGTGTHSELLKNCPAYYDIASSQLAKEVLS